MASDQIHRLWCRRDGSIDYGVDGYVIDPLDKSNLWRDSSLVALADLDAAPCLVLLGEAGMGKSTELRKLPGSDEARSSTFHYVDLKEFGSVDQLGRHLAKRAAGAVEEKRVFLLLDSFDEALVEIRTLIAALPRLLAVFPSEQLSLRIACRTSEWPGSLEQDLRLRWPDDDDVLVLEIVPLRETDVAAIAMNSGADPAGFLEAVARRGVQALASKPTTLMMLLSQYRAAGALPALADDLYDLGCRHLCEEWDQERVDSHRSGVHGPDERLAAARRIAAATVFGSRAAVWMGPAAQCPASDLSIADLARGTEMLGDRAIPISEVLVREALGTGLFSGRGASRMGWGHQSYAEYLAASWVRENKLSQEQVESLFVTGGGGSSGIVPQLHGTAGWLAGMNEPFRRFLGARDPLLVLSSEVALQSESARASAVGSLLALAEKGRFVPPEFRARALYSRLGHRGLTEQLRPVLSRKHEAIEPLLLAIAIANECEHCELGPDLVRLALDGEAPFVARVRAVAAASQWQDEPTLAQLLPLATDANAADEDDELKGAALNAVWPRLLDARELFQSLSPPKNRSLFGLYTASLLRCAKSLSVEAVKPGLAWVSTLDEHDTDARETVADAIISLAWDQSDDPEVLEALAGEVWRRIRAHRAITSDRQGGEFGQKVAADGARRRRLVDALVRRSLASGDQLLWVWIARPGLVLREDCEWLIRKAAEAEFGAAAMWAELAGATFHFDNDAHVAALSQHTINPNLERLVRRFFGPVEIDSAEAEQMREWHKYQVEADNRQARRARNLPLPIGKVLACIADTGQPARERWSWVSHVFALDMNGVIAEDDYLYPSERPLWNECTTEARRALCELALQALFEADPIGLGWYEIGARSWKVGALAGIRGFALLEREAQDLFESVPGDVWTRWSDVILGGPRWGVDGEWARLEERLLQVVDQRAPGAVLASGRRLLAAALAGEPETANLDALRAIHDQSLDSDLVAALKGGVSETIAQELTECLIRRNNSSWKPVGAHLLEEANGSGKVSAVLSGISRAMVRLEPRQWWDLMWPLCEQNPVVGKMVLLDAAPYRELGGRSLLGELSDVELGAFARWMWTHLPPPDPEHQGAYSPDGNDIVRGWRDRAVNALEARGTWDAVRAMQELAGIHPSFEWFRTSALRAEQNARAGQWKAFTPAQVFELARTPENRLVRDAAQLMRVIGESFGRLQQNLHGALRGVQDLWDTRSRTPKDEGEIADYLARHLTLELDERGIVANREVVLFRGGEGGRPGQRTDIYVNAVTAGTAGIPDVVTVILEVKGLWHPELFTAMETQLCDYLARGDRCNHGVYVVAWFDIATWSSTDPRRKAAAAAGPSADVARRLGEQARHLSSQDRVVRGFMINASWE